MVQAVHTLSAGRPDDAVPRVSKNHRPSPRAPGREAGRMRGSWRRLELEWRATSVERTANKRRVGGWRNRGNDFGGEPGRPGIGGFGAGVVGSSSGRGLDDG